jgi:hypothetical protein
MARARTARDEAEATKVIRLGDRLSGGETGWPTHGSPPSYNRGLAPPDCSRGARPTFVIEGVSELVMQLLAA